jgi:hypothetical protein
MLPQLNTGHAFFLLDPSVSCMDTLRQQAEDMIFSLKSVHSPMFLQKNLSFRWYSDNYRLFFVRDYIMRMMKETPYYRMGKDPPWINVFNLEMHMLTDDNGQGLPMLARFELWHRSSDAPGNYLAEGLRRIYNAVRIYAL